MEVRVPRRGLRVDVLPGPGLRQRPGPGAALLGAFTQQPGRRHAVSRPAPAPTRSRPACSAATSATAASPSRMSGPKVFTDAQPRAYLEFDLFGPNGAGDFGSEQNLPRIRAAFVELKSGNTTIQVGQQNQLVVQQIIGSLGHLSNPVSYGAGTIAWRTPGVRLTQTRPARRHEADAGDRGGQEQVVQRGGQQAGSAAAPPPRPASATASRRVCRCSRPWRASTVPAARSSSSATWSASTTPLDLNGFGDGQTASGLGQRQEEHRRQRDRGGRQRHLRPGQLRLQLLHRQDHRQHARLAAQFGDIKDTGYWAQLTGNFTKELSLSLAYGAATPNKDDIRRVAQAPATRPPASPTRSWAACSSTRTVATPSASRAGSTPPTGPRSATTELDTKALQVMATANYYF